MCQITRHLLGGTPYEMNSPTAGIPVVAAVGGASPAATGLVVQQPLRGAHLA
jgi:hypothetical protein